MSTEEVVTTEVARVEQKDMTLALPEAEARAKLMKAILPQLVAVCHKSNILDFDGKPYINNDGCQKIARIAGISFGRPNVMISYEDLPPEPGETWPDSGKVKKRAKPARRAYIVEVEGEASLLGQAVTEFGGASSEDGFFDRPHESPVETRLEVRKKAMANWQGRCVRTLLGLQGMSWSDLENVGFNKGEGGGVNHRTGRHSAHKDGEEDKAATDETKAKIRSQILSDVGGNNQAAVALLERITAFTGKDGKEIPGVANIEKLSEGRAFTTWGRIKPGGKDREAYENALADVKDRFNLWDERPQE